jgi:flagellar hook-associated protein 1
MSDLLAIGASGVKAYQSALTTTSENITNAGSTGYTRRSVQLSEVAATGSSVTQSSVVSGNGVITGGVTRSADEFRSAAVRSAGSDLANTTSSVTWMGRIQSALSDNQLTAQLTTFFTSANAVAADPTATAPRAAMLEDGNGVAQAFTATGNALTQVATDLDASAQSDVTSLNSLASQLANINDGLGRSAQGSAGNAELLDQRDQVLEKMSNYTNISTSMDALGRATVKMGNTDGPVLVSGNVEGFVTYSRNDDGAASFAVHRNGTVSTASPTGGSLAGVADSAQRVADARKSLNDMATSFVNGVNAVQAQGVDLNGNAGAPMFAQATGSPTSISMVLTDPKTIAAASATGGTRDNSNLQNLANLRTSGNYEGGVSDMISTNAAALASRQSIASAQTAIHDGAVTNRDSSAGVNLDNEAVDLMRFQQAYQASSRVIQVARETLQTILAIN